MFQRRSDDSFRDAQKLRFDRLIKDRIGKEDSVDFYKFRTSNSVNFSVSLRGLRANANLTLFNRNRREISLSDRPGTKSESIRKTLNSGIYYVRVEISDRKDSTSYRLEASAKLTEPGETTRESRDLGVLSGNYNLRDSIGNDVKDSQDYYKFKLKEITAFNASISDPLFNPFANLYFDDNNDGIIDFRDRVDQANSARSISEILPPGTYFIEVRSSNVETRYSLDLSAIPQPSNLSSNPGNTPSKALDIGNLSSTFFGAEHVGTLDEIDYFKFSISQTLQLNASIDSSPLTAFANLYFDDNNDGIIDFGDRIAQANTVASISETLSPGTYFMEVKSSINTRYELQLSVS
jgi:hypothetical protein